KNRLYYKLFFSLSETGTDHLRRLIQTAFICFQQINTCDYLNDDQKRLIQDWMNTLSNDNSDLYQDLNDDPLTHRIGILEEALQAVNSAVYF
ncbi:unnamed protein product, partial [Didymodactylos carnosus]